MEYKKIEELTTVVTGGTPSTSKSEYWDDGNIPWLQSGCCQNCDVDSTEKYITQVGYDNSSTRMMPPNTVMIALTGATAGKVGYLNFEACGNQSITGIFPCDKLNQRYLFFFLLSQRDKILTDCVGGAQAHISQGYVKNIVVPILSLQEQGEIVEVLTKLTDVIDMRQNEMNLLDDLIKARFVEMFGNPNVEFKYESHKFKEYTFDMTKGPFGSDMKKDLYVPKGADTYKVYIQINAIQGNQNLGDYYISKEYFKQKISRFEVHPGDFIITCDGTLGKHLKLDENMERGVISPSLLRLTLDESKMTQEYFEYMWDMYMLLLMKKEARNACLVHLPSAKVIGEVDIPVAPFELQKEFSAFVHQVDKSKVAIQKSLDEAQLLFDSLMQKYFG